MRGGEHMGYTISTHNGSSVSRHHNIRNRNITDKEEHIDPFGDFEIWHDENPVKAYQRIFGEALREYNARQSHPERRIYNYYQHIDKSAKQHPVYEMIVGVGRVGRAPDPAIGKEILRKFVDEWKEVNPNLEIIGCYYHADEQGVPHIHIDYIPVAHGYKKGLHTQNGLVKALGEMGFYKSGKDTAQILWQRAENNRLEDICRSYGLDIIHPEKDRQEHLETRIYKLEQRAVSAEERARAAEIKARDLEEQFDQLNLTMKKYEKLEGKYNRLRAMAGKAHYKDGTTMAERFDQREAQLKEKVQEMEIEL